MKFINEMWAVIPARSGSKGLRNKNIKKINGIHLIGYSIIISHKIKDIKKIIFSSDSNKYLNIAKNMDVIICIRDQKKIHLAKHLSFLYSKNYCMNLSKRASLSLNLLFTSDPLLP